MPRKQQAGCVHPGCPNLAVYRGRCQTHRGEAEGDRCDSTQRGYDAAWERLRKQALGADVRCERCRKVRATMLHHIVPIDVAPDLRLDPANLVPVCRRCHAAIHREMDSR